MDKILVAALCAASALIGSIVSAILAAPSDIEYLDKCATMPAEQLKAAARTTTAGIKEANAKAESLNARKTVILAVQDANS